MISSLYGVSGGGAGITANHLARGLSASGNHVAIVTSGRGHHFTVTEEEGLRTYRFRPLNIYPFEDKDVYPVWQKIIWQFVDVYNLHAAGTFRKILEKESPHIVHIHKMRGFSGAAWSVAAKLVPGRVIQTCHDYESMSPDGLLRGRIGKMALRKQGPMRGYQWIRSKTSAGVSAVTAPSSHTLKRIKDSGLFPLAWSRVIANTHGWSQDQLQRIHENTMSILRNSFRFLFLGRLEREKGIIELCEAFLQASRLSPKMRLDIAGWGTLEAELRQKYGDHSGVNFYGALSGHAKEDALANSNVVVVPSLVEEVFGLVAIEAYAFGKPVIASNIGGLPELIKQDETGWLVEPGNVQALANQLDRAANIDTIVLAKMSQNCKDYSYTFSIERILQEYLSIYRRMFQRSLP